MKTGGYIKGSGVIRPPRHMPLLSPAPFFVGVAFRLGDPRNLQDEFVMQTTGGPLIHSEFMLGRPFDIRCYTACSFMQQGSVQVARESGFTPSRRFTRLPTRADGWECICFPLKGGAPEYKAVYSMVLQLIAMQLPYNYKDLWQCCSKAMLPFERDVDFLNTAEWKASGVFCSQMCVLLLRKLDAQGVIELAPACRQPVYTINSRGCSPNRLFHILLLLHPSRRDP
jgi:hypothetical protein